MASLRLFAVIVCCTLPLLVFGLARLRVAVPTNFDARQIPADLGEHQRVSDSQLAEDVLAMVEPISYTLRLYGREDGEGIWAYVAFYSGIGDGGGHDPRICYPSQGWDVADLHDLDVALSDGAHVSTRLMSASLGGARELVLYWFQPAHRWPSRPPVEQALRIGDALAGRPQNAFVRLSTRVREPSVAAEREAEARLVNLARELAPYVRGALEHGSLSAAGRKGGA